MLRTPRRYYLDYAATTPTDSRVVHAMKPYWIRQFANPHSIHQSGVIARKIVSDCTQTIKQLCSTAHDDGVLYTSGGTESNHLALDYAIANWKQNHPDEPYTIVISSVEHPSVVDYLESKYDDLLRISYIPVNVHGVIDLELFKNHIDDLVNVIMVSCVFQSSEVGTTQPIKGLVKIIKNYRSKAPVEAHKPEPCSGDVLVHVDASQGTMYHCINMQDWGVDMVTLCGQKIHGPKGAGVLLYSKDINLSREGTPAVPQIVGMTKALELSQSRVQASRIKMKELRISFFEALDQSGVEYVLNGRKDEASLVINLSFPTDNRDSEQLVVAWDCSGLEVSSKSACMGSQAEDSRVLSAMGLQPHNSIRLCLHHDMSDRDIQKITQRIRQVIKG